jgi:hypothetical protein
MSQNDQKSGNSRGSDDTLFMSDSALGSGDTLHMKHGGENGRILGDGTGSESDGSESSGESDTSQSG